VHWQNNLMELHLVKTPRAAGTLGFYEAVLIFPPGLVKHQARREKSLKVYLSRSYSHGTVITFIQGDGEFEG